MTSNNTLSRRSRRVASTADVSTDTGRSRGDVSRTQQATCPECGGRIVDDNQHADRACRECGLVIEAGQLDHGPEWRNHEGDPETNRERTGAPITELQHDRGLSTKIGWQNKDAYGQALEPNQRAKMKRLRTWDERFRSRDSQDRNLKQAFGEIDRMASALGLPQMTRELAARLYRSAITEGLLPGRCIESVASGCLYAAARNTDAPRSLDEIATVSRVERLRIQRAYRYVARELGLGVQLADPETYVTRFRSKLEFDEEVEYVARELIESAVEHNVHSGRSPLSIAAGALYAAARLTNTDTTQAAVSEASTVSEVTIRDRYQEILEVHR
ncbi:transcription initiation factor IIB [Halomarina rubra]|uniref:Transcription initiation factor IIB n=1 Tax=Halomarina rubra TaxID=2071873 RepID=A0ABD6AY75_9EURY|nr:TFIIB-type zinc ribbon-containing protein [Halomarina rubra]